MQLLAVLLSVNPTCGKLQDVSAFEALAGASLKLADCSLRLCEQDPSGGFHSSGAESKAAFQRNGMD